MATATKDKATASETNASIGSAFVLDDAELETLKSTRGRKEEPSVYLENVKRAVENENDPKYVEGIQLTQTLKAPWVMAQIRKAVKQLGYESKTVTVYDRSANHDKKHPFGFIAFRMDTSKGTEESSEATASE